MPHCQMLVPVSVNLLRLNEFIHKKHQNRNSWELLLSLTFLNLVNWKVFSRFIQLPKQDLLKTKLLSVSNRLHTCTWSLFYPGTPRCRTQSCVSQTKKKVAAHRWGTHAIQQYYLCTFRAFQQGCQKKYVSRITHDSKLKIKLLEIIFTDLLILFA